MSAGVFTLEHRFKFVEKESADVGDGTAFPMEITLEQLAELGYRVKDAWCVAGSLTLDGTTTITSTDPPPSLVNDLINYSNQRGYYTADSVPAHFDAYFDASYTVDSFNVRELGDNERGLWVPTADDSVSFSGQALSLGPAWPPGYGFGEFGCAFSMFLWIDSSDEPTDYSLTYSPWDEEEGMTSEMGLGFSGDVAWVGGTGPFDPNATLYLGVYFYITGAPSPDCSSLSSEGSLIGGVYLELKMHTGTARCQLYGDPATTGSTWVFEAKEWFPYNNDGPVWDSTTGEKL
jgi:hypothetical protein